MEDELSIGNLWNLGVLKGKLSEDRLNDLILLSNQSLENNVDWSWNLVGQIRKGSQVKVDLPISFFSKHVVAYISSVFSECFPNLRESNLEVESAWVVSQYSGDYNPAHSHGSLISGIVYLEVPNQVSKSSNEYDGCLHFINGNFHQRSLLNFGARLITPKKGDYYIFPGYLTHVVYPFFGEGERRCISFNINIKGVD